jgi:hypothetical protein
MITQQEYDRLKALHRNIAYTQEEMNFLIKVAKENVDPNVRVCPTCNSSISDFKQKLYGWFLNNEEEIIKSFSVSEGPVCQECGGPVPDKRYKRCKNCK